MERPSFMVLPKFKLAAGRIKTVAHAVIRVVSVQTRCSSVWVFSAPTGGGCSLCACSNRCWLRQAAARPYVAMAQAQATHNTITLKGSTKIVTEFFAYAVNSILYQRGIYPPDNFEQRKQYGLSIMVSTDTGLTDYLSTVLEQMSDWLVRGELQKMVLVITSSETKETLERWTFDLQTDKSVLDGRSAPEKSDKEITSEIQAIIRQITASVTFLPLLNDACTFDLLVYTDAASNVPTEWEDSDPRFIQNAADVKLRSFTTKVHKVDALVSYRADDN